MRLTSDLMKLLLIIFSGVVALFGIILITAGSLVVVSAEYIKHFVGSELYTPAYVLVVAGLIMFFIAFIGIYGALRENFCLLITFTVLLSIVLVSEVAVGIAVLKYKGQFEDAVKKKLSDSMRNYGKYTSEKRAWDVIQFTLHCCGIHGRGDWPERGLQTPDSCCDDTHKFVPDQGLMPFVTQTNLECVLKDYYKVGCYGKVKSIILSKSNVLIGLGITFAIIQIAGIVFAVLLALKARKRRSRR